MVEFKVECPICRATNSDECRGEKCPMPESENFDHDTLMFVFKNFNRAMDQINAMKAADEEITRKKTEIENIQHDINRQKNYSHVASSNYKHIPNEISRYRSKNEVDADSQEFVEHIHQVIDHINQE